MISITSLLEGNKTKGAAIAGGAAAATAAAIGAKRYMAGKKQDNVNTDSFKTMQLQTSSKGPIATTPLTQSQSQALSQPKPDAIMAARQTAKLKTGQADSDAMAKSISQGEKDAIMAARQTAKLKTGQADSDAMAKSISQGEKDNVVKAAIAAKLKTGQADSDAMAKSIKQGSRYDGYFNDH